MIKLLVEGASCEPAYGAWRCPEAQKGERDSLNMHLQRAQLRVQV